MKRILYGICGIGLGHTHRQLPILDHLARKHRIHILAYGESHRFCTARYRRHPRVTVGRVAVPFIAGDRNGLDFTATARHPANRGRDFNAINWRALARASRIIGTPDLVISDYEPISAAYAYMRRAPLVTIDQQSKYLSGSFPRLLGGQGYADEVARLRLFFPRADARIAVSFFRVRQKPGAEDVRIYPPVIKDWILSLERKPAKTPAILTYLSSQQELGQRHEDIARLLRSINATFHVFVKGAGRLRKFSSPKLAFHEHGDPRFRQVMRECTGIISTAGHTLLSEAMYLGIPVYALPLPVYEQQMNASIIARNGFGASHPRIGRRKLADFIRNLPRYARNIKRDTRVLLRRPGQREIIAYLEKNFL
jgi:uncharacterized protein (TIGR00661 family)